MDCDGMGLKISLSSNRVLQHYTSNPLNAFTGKIEQPILKLDYFLLNKEHSGKIGTISLHYQ